MSQFNKTNNLPAEAITAYLESIDPNNTSDKLTSNSGIDSQSFLSIFNNPPNVSVPNPTFENKDSRIDFLSIFNDQLNAPQNITDMALAQGQKSTSYSIDVNSLFGEVPAENQRIEESDKKQGEGLDFEHLENSVPQPKKVINLEKKTEADTPFSFVNPFDLVTTEANSGNASPHSVPFNEAESKPKATTPINTQSSAEGNSETSRLVYKRSFRIPNTDLFFDDVRFAIPDEVAIKHNARSLSRYTCEMALPTGNSIICSHGLVGYNAKKFDTRLRLWNDINATRQIIEDNVQKVYEKSFWKPAEGTKETHIYMMGLYADHSLRIYSLENNLNEKEELKYKLVFGFKAPKVALDSKWYHLIAWSPADVGTFALASIDHGLKIFSANFQNFQNLLDETSVHSRKLDLKCTKTITSMKFSADGKTLAVGFENGKVSLLGIKDGMQTSNELISFSETLPITYLEFVKGNNQDILIVGINKNTTILLYNLKTAKVVQTLKFKINTLFHCFNCLSYAHLHNYLFVGCNIRKSLICFHFNINTCTFDYVTEISNPDGFIEICASDHFFNEYLNPRKPFLIVFALQSIGLVRFSIGLKNIYCADTSLLEYIPTKYHLSNKDANQSDEKIGSPSEMTIKLWQNTVGTKSTKNQVKSSPTLNKFQESNKIESAFIKSPEQLQEANSEQSFKPSETATPSLHLDRKSRSRNQSSADLAKDSAFGTKERAASSGNILDQSNHAGPSEPKKSTSSSVFQRKSAEKEILSSETKGDRDSTRSPHESIPDLLKRFNQEITHLVKKGASTNLMQTNKNITEISSMFDKYENYLKNLPIEVSQLIEGTVNTNVNLAVQQSLRAQFSQEFSLSANSIFSNKEFQGYLNELVKKNIQEALSSPGVVKSISETLSNQVQQQVISDFRESFQKTLIPAYQSATNSMFEQMQNSFMAKITKIQEQQENILNRMQSISALGPIPPPPMPMYNMNMPMRYDSNGPQPPLPPNNPFHSFNQSVLNFASFNNKNSNLVPNEGAGIQNFQQPPMPIASQQQNNITPQQSLASIFNQVPESYNKAEPVGLPSTNSVKYEFLEGDQDQLIHAINTNNINTVVLLFKKFGLEQIVEKTEFSQKDLLILCKLSSKHIHLDYSLKLKIMGMCFDKLTPKDSSIAHHARRFLSTVQTILQEFHLQQEKINPNSDLVKELVRLNQQCTELVNVCD